MSFRTNFRHSNLDERYFTGRAERVIRNLAQCRTKNFLKFGISLSHVFFFLDEFGTGGGFEVPSL